MSALPPAPTIDWQAALVDLAAQPELFDRTLVPQIKPAEQALTRTAASFRYSGKITSQDEGRCLLIGGLVMTGRFSLRKIAEVAKCDHRTVAAVIRHLEEQKLLPALQTRVERLLGETELEVLLWVDELIASRCIGRDTAATLRSLFTGMGIAADKRIMAANGLAGTNLSIQVGVSIRGAGDQVESWESKLKAAIGAPSDSQSAANPPIPVESEVTAAPYARPDASPNPSDLSPTPPPSPLPPPPDPSISPEATPVGTGGGGSPTPARPERTDGIPPS